MQADGTRTRPLHTERSIPRVCGTCGRPFLVSEHALERGPCRFCGRDCALRRDRRRWPTPRRRPGPAPDRFWAKVDRTDRCWLWTGGTSGGGYGAFWLNGKQVHAHRYAYELAHGPIPAGMYACHTCDRYYAAGDASYRRCVNPAHLFLGDAAANATWRGATGRAATGQRNGWATHPGRTIAGERNPRAVLTRALVDTIRARYAAGGVTAQALGREYGVSKTAVLRALHGRTWGQLV